MKASASSFVRRVKTLAFASFALVFVGMGAWSCVGEGEEEMVPCPDKDVFTLHVSPYIERRCGMLDCHGTPMRNMRIYGQLGLRHPNEPDGKKNVAGGAATTQTELDANFAAVCNLEPEAMQGVLETFGASAEKLLLVTKARGAERHKGGTVVNENDEGDRCILNWLKRRGEMVVAPDCAAAVDRLK
jgi:hypothetical protein